MVSISAKASMKVEKAYRPTSPWQDRWRQVAHNRMAVIGFILLGLLVGIAIFASFVAPFDPFEMDLENNLQPPSPAHLLGTDKLGRDVLSRVIYGSRVSLVVGFIVQGIALVVGVTLGAISGYFGGVLDMVIQRIVDVVMGFPFLILAIAIVSLIGPSLTNMMVVLGGVVWVDYARMVRGVVLSLKEEEYVVAARVVGASDSRIILRHVLPGTLNVIIVQATFGIATAILAASGLSFLGMGAQPPTAEWGAMLADAKPYLRQLPLMSIAPGVAIMLTVLSINFVGDALRDAFDPRVLKV
ncbi:MAG TPA: nickel transporter permease [Anaerolineaceae bacterium]|nr:nickel transporter permease [Anaerolineaceae bacterium]